MEFEQLYDLFFREYPDILNTEQVSEILHISLKTVYQLIKQGKIKGILVGKHYCIPKISIIYYLRMDEVLETEQNLTFQSKQK